MCSSIVGAVAQWPNKTEKCPIFYDVGWLFLTNTQLKKGSPKKSVNETVTVDISMNLKQNL